MKHGETSRWRLGGTTIIANLEGMAADSRVSVEGSAFYHAQKIERIGDRLFGGAGDGMMCLIMFEWYRTAVDSRGKFNPKKLDRKKLYENWTEHTERSACWILELNRDGLYIWDGWGVPEKLKEERYAIGSGQIAALAAYDTAKLSLEECVKIAAGYDQYTGAPIQMEYLASI